MKEKVLAELKNTFRPEFLNRIDATVVFHQLTREEIREIVDLLLERVKTQLAGQEMELQVTDAAKDAIIAKGYDQAFGARPLRREIQNQIEDPLAERMLQAAFQAGDTIVVDAGPDGTLTIDRSARPAKRQTAKAGR
jgi:ATP-dependent Clp protease ATP-binding subunit ClpC